MQHFPKSIMLPGKMKHFFFFIRFVSSRTNMQHKWKAHSLGEEVQNPSFVWCAGVRFFFFFFSFKEITTRHFAYKLRELRCPPLLLLSMRSQGSRHLNTMNICQYASRKVAKNNVFLDHMCAHLEASEWFLIKTNWKLRQNCCNVCPIFYWKSTVPSSSNFRWRRYTRNLLLRMTWHRCCLTRKNFDAQSWRPAAAVAEACTSSWKSCN